MRLLRRQFLCLIIIALILPSVVHAQSWPARTITLIVPFAAGGATDVSARIVADHMSRTLGQQIVVQNVPGAGGTVGSARAMRADPDGTTILMGHVGTHAVAVPLYPNLAYKPETDFEPIGLVSEFPVFIAARKDFPANDLGEFIAYVKANADKLNVGHAGVGSVFYISALLLHSLLNVKPTLVPFGGGLPAMNALVAGQVDYLCADVTTGAPQLAAGRIKAYAIASPARSPALPNVPTTAEAGLPEFRTSAWFGLFAPRGTPRPVLDRLAEALERAQDDAGVRKRMQALASELPDRPRRGPQVLRSLLKDEIARWTPVIRAVGAKVE
jgi:tripartite-type tricarboxylate transporter receptor subunit TctC